MTTQTPSGAVRCKCEPADATMCQFPAEPALQESDVVAMLAFIAQDLLEKKPEDPITHILENVLTFPFAGPHVAAGSGGGGVAAPFVRPAALHVPTLCLHCNKARGPPALLSQYTPSHIRPCCVYELRGSFHSAASDFMTGLADFLNSSDSVMVVVGHDKEGKAASLQASMTKGCRSNKAECCDCTGSGKSRLRRWLTFPGPFVHKRQVLVIDSENAQEVVAFLGAFDGADGPMTSPNKHALRHVMSKGTPRGSAVPSRRGSTTAGRHPSEILGSKLPTLTLIEGLEPPHSILHALMTHNFFRAERMARCGNCTTVVQTAIHKTIIFTRPDVFFKFPLPCPIHTIKRCSQLYVPLADDGARQDGMFNSSFTNIILEPESLKPTGGASSSPADPNLKVTATTISGIASTTSPISHPLPQQPAAPHQKRRRTTKLLFACESDSASHAAVDPSTQIPITVFKESQADNLDEVVKVIYREMCLFFEQHNQARPATGGGGGGRLSPGECQTRGASSRAISITFDVSPTFRSLTYSRSRVETALATYMVERGVSPSFDLSEFPNLLICIARHPRADIYITRYLDRIIGELKKAVLPSRLDIGNLLCLVCASQQCVSCYTPPVTASDLLQLYLDAFIEVKAATHHFSSSGGVAGAMSPIGMSPVHGSIPLDQSAGSLSVSMTALRAPRFTQQTLMTLDIQNLVIENFFLEKQKTAYNSGKAVLVSHSLLDARGADIAPDLLHFLVRGTTVQAFLKSNNHNILNCSSSSLESSLKKAGEISPAITAFTATAPGEPVVLSPNTSTTSVNRIFPQSQTPSTVSAMPSAPLLDHPVLLLSDITEVGPTGYEGHGVSRVLHCFYTQLANDGITIILVVEKNSVVARMSFADPDTQTSDSAGSSSQTRVGVSVSGGVQATVEELETSTDILWAVHYSAKKFIANAMLLSENVPITSHDRGINHDILLLVHNDASCSFISVNDVPHGANVRVQQLVEPEVAHVSFVRKSSAHSMGRKQSSMGSFPLLTSTGPPNSVPGDTAVLPGSPPTLSAMATPMDAGMGPNRSANSFKRLSLVSNNSRITVDLPFQLTSTSEEYFLGNERSDSNLLDEAACMPNDFVTVLDAAELKCDDPCAVALSPRYVAVCDQDSDLIVVLRNPFAGRNTGGGLGTSTSNEHFTEEEASGKDDTQFFQVSEGHVTSLVICNDILIAGMETGTIQSFSLATGKEVATMEHHEGAVTILRSLTKPPLKDPSQLHNIIGISSSFSLSLSANSRPGHPPSPSPATMNFFISGSEDSTITVWNSSNGTLVRTLCHHEAAVVDIASANFFQNKVIISCDRSGLLTVVSLNPDDMRAPFQVIWMSSFSSLRHLSLSRSGAWLVCSRHQQATLAMPIAQWALRGSGQFHRKPISVLHISLSERLLFTGGEDGAIFVWQLDAKMSFLLCFRQHAANSTITSISTTSDEKRVASADNKKFIYIWNLETHATELPKMLDRGGGGAVKFIAHDYLVVQTRKGVKLMDSELKVITSSNNTLAEGAFDVYVATEAEYAECFSSLVAKAAADRLQQQQEEQRQQQGLATVGGGGGADDSQAQSPLEPHPALPTVEFPQIVIGGDNHGQTGGSGGPSDALIDLSIPSPSPTRRCFIGICRSNADRYSIPIFTGESLGKSTPCFELWRGDVEDEFGDEEEVVHTDTIKAFVFLQPRNVAPPGSSSSMSIPNLHLAASAGDDLTVILWNWRRQMPLCSLQHTQFVNAVSFLPVTSEAHYDYSPNDMAYLRRKHPSFVDNDLLVTKLVTCQDADSTNGTTIRVFDVCENPRSFQKRFLANRCGQPVTTVTFDYKMLQVNEVSTAKSPNTQSMPRCIVARKSDSLLLTGHDHSNEVVFWKWLPVRPVLTAGSALLTVIIPSLNTSQQSDSSSGSGSNANFFDECDIDDSDEDRFAKKEKIEMCLRPLRRLVSRV